MQYEVRLTNEVILVRKGSISVDYEVQRVRESSQLAMNRSQTGSKGSVTECFDEQEGSTTAFARHAPLTAQLHCSQITPHTPTYVHMGSICTSIYTT